MSAPRFRNVLTQRELQGIRDDMITAGYTVINEGESTVLLRRNTWGSMGAHILLLIFTGWWLIGLGNLIYALIAHYTADQVLIRVHTGERPLAQDYPQPI